MIWPGQSSDRPCGAEEFCAADHGDRRAEQGDHGHRQEGIAPAGELAPGVLDPREHTADHRRHEATGGQAGRPERDGVRPLLDRVRACGEHRDRRREDRSRAEPSDDLTGEQHPDVRGRREEAEQATDHDQGRAGGQQPLAAEQVPDHAEGELEQGHRDQEGVGDPGQLRGGEPEVLVDVAVDDRRDAEAELRDETRGDGCHESPRGQPGQGGGQMLVGSGLAHGDETITSGTLMYRFPDDFFRFPRPPYAVSAGTPAGVARACRHCSRDDRNALASAEDSREITRASSAATCGRSSPSRR